MENSTLRPLGERGKRGGGQISLTPQSPLPAIHTKPLPHACYPHQACHVTLLYLM
ncbi:hypothetical protein HanIR_Chr11g0558941 [Helianthus annuus]|nr:hypothetical protein HanIR_Chr11g0558941 [Helianthus annuus]